MACDLEFVVVSCCDHGVHFFKGHAQGMVIVGINAGSPWSNRWHLSRRAHISNHAILDKQRAIAHR